MQDFSLDCMKLFMIQAYAPTTEASDEDKENFYDQLQSVIDGIQKHDIHYHDYGDARPYR